jgi:hypothetical protein
MPWHKGLVAYTSLRRPGFYPRLVCVGFLVDEATLWRAFFFFCESFSFPWYLY